MPREEIYTWTDSEIKLLLEMEPNQASDKCATCIHLKETNKVLAREVLSSEKTKKKVKKIRRLEMRCKKSKAALARCSDDMPLEQTDGPSPKKVCAGKLLGNDQMYYISDSPRKLKARLDRSSQQVQQLERKLKLSQQQCRRLKVRVNSMKTVVKQLRKKNLISSNCEEVLDRQYLVFHWS
eukprot:gene5624-10836_t